MNIVIVGGRQEVYYLAKSFLSKGYNTTIINKDRKYCNFLARIYKAQIVYGDGTNPYILEDAGIAYADIVLALTPKDPDNLVICQLAQKKYQVSKTFAVVNSPSNIEIFKALGVDTVISTSSIISSLIEQIVSIGDINNLTPIGEGKLAIMEIEMRDDFPTKNLMIKEIALPKDSLVGCIIRDNSALIPRGDTYIKVGDKLVILTLPTVQSEVLQVIRGRID